MLQLVYLQLVVKKLDCSEKNEHIINALNDLEYNYNLEDNIKIQQLLVTLQTRKNVNRQDMLQLEFKYSDLFFSGETENLKPMKIYRIFRDNPKSFIDILKRKSKSEIESSQNLQAIQLVIKYLCYKKVFPFETKEQFQK